MTSHNYGAKLKQSLSTLNNSIQRLLGQYCAVCQFGSRKPLCKVCTQNITRPQHACYLCGCSLTADSAARCCKTCLESPPAFDAFYSLGTYENQLADLIIAAKVAKKISAIEALRYLLQHHLYNDDATKAYFLEHKGYTLLAVPTPKSRLIRRGFNLPLWLAEDIGKCYKMPILSSKTITLPFFTHKQSVFSKQQRQKNKQIYQINHNLPKKILIIDDVFTTGETINKLAYFLRQNNTKSVSAYTISRGQLN